MVSKILKKTGAPKIQVFFLTYERPVLFAKALKSVLLQDYSNFEIVVSDNSRSDATQKIVEEIQDPRLFYRRRIPSMPPLQHFNQVLCEVSEDFFMVFHDDDIMLPNGLSSLMHGFASEKELVAVGGNATLLYNKFVSHRKFITKQRNILIRNPQNLLRRYFSSASYAPFPAYLYYKPLLGELTLKATEGKHSDVIFLTEASLRGQILMITDVVMQYRVHMAQDTAVCNLKDRNLLVNWVCRNGFLDRKSPYLKFYKLTGLIEKTRQKRRPNSRLRMRLLCALTILHLKYFRLQFFFLFIRLSQRLLQKMCMNRVTKKD